MSEYLFENRSVLIVDDEENIREILKMTLSKLGVNLFDAETAEDGLEILKEENIDVIISDIMMPGMSGLDFLQTVKAETPGIMFLMITAHGNMQIVIDALRSGASDFLVKPFVNSELRDIVAKLLVEKEQRKEPVHPISKEDSNQFDIDGIIGESRSFKQAVKLASKASKSDSSVLILGESGTGKEVFARAIHENSDRKDKPFIAINCGAIPENLIESELFGHVKGAFTGASNSKVGKFELAESGTIFLDEIGEMPLPLQVKLLRVLQERTIEPVGSAISKKIDFRLIAATHRDLESKAKSGEFREDLFYRLNVIPLNLPSLNERQEDIIPLAKHFLNEFNKRYSESYSITSEHEAALQSYSWPGNIRELENILERAVVLGDEGCLFFNLPTEDASEDESEPKTERTASVDTDGMNFKDQKKAHEKEQIIKALETNRWNKTKTAEYLKISRRSLLYKIKEYQIS